MIWPEGIPEVKLFCDKLDKLMKLYRFLSGPDDSSFCHKVTDALNKGWELHGSPTYTDGPDGLRCGQAVTKEVAHKVYHPDMKLGEQ